MRHVLIVLSLLGGFFALSSTEAGAVVCARGVYRAGCAGPNGAVGVRRGYYGPGRAVAVRRGYYGPVVRRSYYGPRGAVVVRRRW
ncbi:hypothetical protein [Microvirga sp. TS319]|uniref:hypothetical protein n=1 Tax=Microvirga sp. TS319 TaxID=3241165 RepID=UPI00351A97CA